MKAISLFAHMKKGIFILIALSASICEAFAGALNNIHSSGTSNSAIVTPPKEAPQTGNEAGFFDGSIDLLKEVGNWVLWGLLGLFLLWMLLKIIRLSFELYYSKNLRYLQVCVPKADSKLDKERETKKDFKEKIGIMSMFYKAIHKLSEAGLKDTFLNAIFRHSKISLELVYKDGEVIFYVVTYKSYVSLVRQHLVSIYPDAEVEEVSKDYIDLRPTGYHLRAASLGKENDDVFPIKTFKYLEEDALNNFTSVF